MRGNWDLFLFCLPGMIITLIYHYWPIYGIQIAFRDYKVKLGMFNSEWIGFSNFARFFRSANAWITIRNTLILSVYSLAAGFPIAVILALLLNSFRFKKYRKIIQTVTYAPHFISTVVMCGMLFLFLSVRTGAVNTIIRMLGGEPINFMGKSSLWRHIYVWSGVWQSMGWSSVIYFAALSGVDPQLYEAAEIDGARKWKQMINITLPAITPTIVIMLILNCNNIVNAGFDQIFMLYSALVYDVADIIDTYVYRIGIQKADYSFSTAAGMFKSIIALVMILIVNFVAKKTGNEGIW